MNLVVWDLETTGLDMGSDGADIVQFAAIRYENNKEVSRLKFLCKPSKPIEKGAEEVHGITNEMVSGQPPFSKFATQVAKILGGAIQAGYNNAPFDLPILQREMEKCGYDDFFGQSYVYDSFDVFKRHCSRKLADAYAYYGFGELVGGHNALVDVEATAKIIAAQVKRENLPLDQVAATTCPAPDKRVGFSNHISFNDNNEPYITFGKYKGSPLKEVDKGFLKWMLSKDFPAPVKNYIKQYI